MSIRHIVEVGYVVVEPIADPLEQPTWLPAASNDLLAYATPIIGPLSTLIVQRMARYFAAGDTWHQFDLGELGQTFGVSGAGVNSPLIRSFARIDRFGFGQLDARRPKLRIRPMIPPLSRRLAERPVEHPMSITFCGEAHSEAEDDALASENAPTLNVHNTGAWTLLAVLGIESDHYGTIEPVDLLARVDAAPVGPIPEHPGLDYVVARLPLLRTVAVAAHRLGRQVVWG